MANQTNDGRPPSPPLSLRMRRDDDPHRELPLGRSTGPDGTPRHIVALPDGRRLNLLPSFADLEAVIDGRRELAPGARDADADFRALVAGVPPGAAERPWSARFDDYFRARAAVNEMPTALAGMALRPVADGLYRVVDEIPAALRRPFDRAAGILLDNLASAPASALGAHLPLDHGPLPTAVDLHLAAYPQIKNSCGETMVATWLKGQGVPIALGEVDTQMPFFEGLNFIEDAELRSRGFTLVSGPGTFDDLKTYLAMGYPAMVSIGLSNGTGHYATVIGYDDAAGVVIVDNYRANGQVDRVPYAEFQADWARHQNLLAVACPQRDARLQALRDAGRLSRKAEIQPGLSLSDIWVTQRLRFFVEVAYRYKGTRDDLTLVVNLNTAERERGLANMVGGSVSYTRRLDADTAIDIYAEHLATRHTADLHSLPDLLDNIAAYVGVRHKHLHGRAGYDQGAFQLELGAELTRRLSTLGAEARVAIQPDGTYQVFLGTTGTF